MNIFHVDKKEILWIGGGLIGFIIFAVLIMNKINTPLFGMEYISSSPFFLPVFILVSSLFFLIFVSIYFCFLYLNLKNELIEKEEQVDFLHKITESFNEIDKEVWSSPIRVQCKNRLPRQERKTRFISIVNLKGGVGKTTLTANLSATLSTKYGYNSLIVDMDFQRSLTSRCIDPELYAKLYAEDGGRSKSVCMLLGDRTTPSQLKDLFLEMKNEKRIKIIPSYEFLDTEDTKKQIDFILNSQREVRLEYTRLLHQQEITAYFDFVIFDCPPRLTTSAINALICSDYYIVPTKLDIDSADAVFRTLRRVGRIEKICDLQCLGVIANEVPYHGGKPLVKFGELYDSLKKRLNTNDEIQHTYLFDSMIGESWRQASVMSGKVPCLDASTDAQFTADIHAVTEEFLKRKRDYEN